MGERSGQKTTSEPRQTVGGQASQLRQLSELQSANVKTILAEADEQREFTAEVIQSFCTLLDKFSEMRAAMKDLRKKYVTAESSLLKFQRAEKAAADLPPDVPEDDPEADVPPEDGVPITPVEEETAHAG